MEWNLFDLLYYMLLCTALICAAVLVLVRIIKKIMKGVKNNDKRRIQELSGTKKKRK